MGSFSDYLENEALDHIMGKGSFAVPTNIYIALSTADPLDTAAGIAEPVGNGYARVQHNSWKTAVSRKSENNGAITFAAATGSWGTITHFAIYDAVTGGNMLAHGALSQSNAVVSGNIVSFADAEIDVSFNAGKIGDYAVHKILDHIFKVVSWTMPTVIAVGLSTADPGDDGSGIAEPSGNAYARVSHAPANWSVASGGATDNTGAITFPTATGAWGTITHMFIKDATSGGNLLWHAALGASQAVVSGNIVEFADGDLDVSIA